MKKDMAKVLKNRSYYRYADTHPKQQRIDGMDIDEMDQLPKRERMGQRWGSWRYGNERDRRIKVRVIERFLLSRVGQKWDDVWSEICRHNSQPYSFIQYQLRDMIKPGEPNRYGMGPFVEGDVAVIDGKPWNKTHGYELKLGRNEINSSVVWVHPETGVLMKVPEKKRERYNHEDKRTFKQVTVGENHRYVCVKGVWYLVELAPIPVRENHQDEKSVPAVHDVVLHCNTVITIAKKDDKLHCFGSQVLDSGSRACWRAWGGFLYAVSKRQVGKAEIKVIRRRLVAKAA
ncbi:MAG: hypothetical protein K2W82_10945 [Candidatus Obscuribacterales bacterium]|nr:hypothetical protein [Candidatus Obscuribacterales bacterium]